MIVKFPGSLTVITPAHEHIRIEDLSMAGAPCTSTVMAAEIQGVTGTGTQGGGVPVLKNTGFKGELHVPNGSIFLMGAISVILPISIISAITVRPGVTTKGVGIVPKQHLMNAAGPTTARLMIQPHEKWDNHSCQKVEERRSYAPHQKRGSDG